MTCRWTHFIASFKKRWVFLLILLIKICWSEHSFCNVYWFLKGTIPFYFWVTYDKPLISLSSKPELFLYFIISIFIIFYVYFGSALLDRGNRLMICCFLHSKIKKTVPKTLSPEATEIIKEASLVIDRVKPIWFTDRVWDISTCMHLAFFLLFFLVHSSVKRWVCSVEKPKPNLLIK